MKVALLLLLLPNLADADLRPRKDASKRGDVAFWIERRGTGDVPYASDEITYRVDFYWNHREPVETTKETARVSQLVGGTDWLTDLGEMRVGERRYVWGRMQNGNHCDHFGCGIGPEPYTAIVELERVTPHHDPLPGRMRIAAHPLRVVDGEASALLPSDPIKHIDRIEVGGGVVTLHLQLNPYGMRADSFTIAELRARLTHARAVSALRAGDVEAAQPLLDEALATDPDLRDARAHRAALGNADDLARLVRQNPVWLAWFARTDPFAKALVKQLPAPVPGGRIEATQDLVLHVEPTNRWIGVSVVPGYGGEAMRVFDRATGALVATIPLDKRGIRALVTLGFRPTPTKLDRDETDLQTTRIDRLAVARWRHEPTSDVRVTLLPK